MDEYKKYLINLFCKLFLLSPEKSKLINFKVGEKCSTYINSEQSNYSEFIRLNDCPGS